MRNDNPACPSCGVAYRDHPGLHGTCQRLQDVRVLVDEAIYYLSQLPALDVDADEFDLSPEDAAGHIGGLVLRRLNKIQSLFA